MGVDFECHSWRYRASFVWRWKVGVRGLDLVDGDPRKTPKNPSTVTNSSLRRVGEVVPGLK